MRALVVALLILFLARPDASALAQAPLPERLKAAIARIDDMAAAEHARDNVGSLSVGVISGGRLVWTKSYGLADMESKTPATADTVYRIGSITKPFTALMLLQLAQEGKVNLSDPVDKYFPEVTKIQKPSAGAPRITLEQLATMTSGLAREPANVSSYNIGRVSDWETTLLAALPHTRYEFAPGSRYFYSNIGYATLGAALARAAGMPYVQYIEERILTPLDMKHTAFERNDAIRSRIATGYNLSPAGHVSSDWAMKQQDGRGYRVPNGGLYSTVGDLSRFVAFELGLGPESVLKKQVLEETFERLSWSSARKDSAYGIGMRIQRVGNLIAFGHGGDVPGYVANARFDRASKTGVIVLRSANGGRFDLRGLTYGALAELGKR